MRQLILLCFALGCVPQTNPTLEIFVEPKALMTNGTPTRIRIVATTSKGTVGEGSVSLNATAGLIDESMLTLDKYGTARATFMCDEDIDPNCSAPVELEAEWQTGGTTVTAKVNLTKGTTPGGAGSNTGQGGGPGGGPSPGTPPQVCVPKASDPSKRGFLSVVGRLSTRAVNTNAWSNTSGGVLQVVLSKREFQDSFFTLDASVDEYFSWGFTLTEPYRLGVTYALEEPDFRSADAGNLGGFVGRVVRNGRLVDAVGCSIGTLIFDGVSDAGAPDFRYRDTYFVYGRYSYECPDSGVAINGCFRVPSTYE